MSLEIKLPDAKTAAICVSIGLLGFLYYRHILLQSALKNTQRALQQSHNEMNQRIEEMQTTPSQKPRINLPPHRINQPATGEASQHSAFSSDTQTVQPSGMYNPQQHEVELDPETSRKIALAVAARAASATE